MDTITHVITGAVMAGPAKEKLGWTGAAALLAGSFAPDADMWIGMLGSGTYLKYHRVVTNSVAGMAVIPVIVAWLVWRMGKYDNFKVLYLLVLAAYLMHVFMDLTNSYGCKLLWPFSGRWYALDSVFIVDPWITGLLLLSLALMVLNVKPAPAAAACFFLLFSYWGLRFYTHSQAVDFIKSREPAAVKVGAFPGPVNPFAWRVVAETPDRFGSGWYDLRTHELRDWTTLDKPPDNEAVRRAREAPVAKVFLDFARFPRTAYEKVRDGWVVSFQDLRFSLKPADRRFVAVVKVADDGRILEDNFKF